MLDLADYFATLFWVKSPSLVCSTFTGQVSDLHWSSLVLLQCCLQWHLLHECKCYLILLVVYWLLDLSCQPLNTTSTCLIAWMASGIKRHSLHQTFLLTTKHHLLQQLGWLWASYCWNQFRQDLFGAAFIGWSKVEINIYILLLHHIHSWDLVICFSCIHSCDFGRLK
jgi:hypothetical protein